MGKISVIKLAEISKTEQESLLRELYHFMTKHFSEVSYENFLSYIVNMKSAKDINIVIMRDNSELTLQALAFLNVYQVEKNLIMVSLVCKDKKLPGAMRWWFRGFMIFLSFKMRHLFKDCYFFNLTSSPLSYCYIVEYATIVYPAPHKTVPEKYERLLSQIKHALGRKSYEKNKWVGVSVVRSVDSDIDWLAKEIHKKNIQAFEFYVKNVPNKKNNHHNYGMYTVVPINFVNIIGVVYKFLLSFLRKRFITFKYKQKEKKRIDKSLLQDYSSRMSTIREYNLHRLSYPAIASRRILDEDGSVLFNVNPEVFGVKKDSLLDTYINNIGDPWHETKNTTRDTKYFERSIIEIMSHYLNQGQEKLKGHVTAGGTESNICAFWYGRNCLSESQDTKVALICGHNAHYSVPKACNILNVHSFVVEDDDRHRMDIKHLQETIELAQSQGYNRFIFNFTLGTTHYGAVDDVPAYISLIKQLLPAGTFYVHLDAAILGTLLPIVPLFEREISNIFAYVDSLSISSHKLVGTLLVSSILLVKAEILDKFEQNFKNPVSYFFNLKDTTITGSRSGFNIIELHYLIKQLEFDKQAAPFRRIVQKALHNARYFYEKMQTIVGAERVTYHPNQFNIVFPQTNPSLSSDYLIAKYSLMPYLEKYFVVQIFPQINRQDIDVFLKEYAEIMNLQGLISV